MIRPRLEFTLPTILLVLWLLAMISLPIVRWTVGDGLLPWSVTLGVIMQALLVLVVLYQALRLRSILLILAIILPVSWLLEFIGSSTGYPFGQYHYTDRLIPQIGHVPLIIPLSWLMMLPPSWSIAKRICRRTSGWAFVLLSGGAMMAWDLYLDPQMVGWQFWIWGEQPMLLGGYFGIPWLNYFGWFFSAALLTWLVTLAVDLDALFDKSAHGSTLDFLWLVYIITWLLEVGGLAFFWGLIGPAICGFVGMGSLIVWGFVTDKQASKPAYF